MMRMDVAIGMAFSIMIMSSIIVTTAGSLHAKGMTDISTAEEAACYNRYFGLETRSW